MNAEQKNMILAKDIMLKLEVGDVIVSKVENDIYNNRIYIIAALIDEGKKFRILRTIDGVTSIVEGNIEHWNFNKHFWQKI
jgi:hypothetical protein